LYRKGIKVAHRKGAQVVDRLRQKAKQENDVENGVYQVQKEGLPMAIQGEYSKIINVRKAYKKRIWWVLIVVLLVILAIIYG